MAEKKSNVPIIVGLLIVAVVIVAFFGFNMSPQPIVTNNEAKVTVDENGNEVVVNTATNFDYMMPEGWDRYENAIEDIQSLGEGQIIVPGIIQDPIDENIYYFASYIYDEEAQENLISIYKYNGFDYSFERLYKGTHGLDSALRMTDRGEVLQNGKSFTPHLDIVGYDGGYLVMRPLPNSDDNECGKSFTTEGAPFVKMSIQEPYSGFTDFKTSEELWKTVQNIVAECEQ
ncbi:MAG: hypothetical protein ABH826_04010 [Patescibacteria group bacterium]